MALVEICNEYVDAAPAGTRYSSHFAACLTDGRTIVFDYKVGVGQLVRAYTISGTGWTRSSEATTTAIEHKTARACAATMDGNVLAQCQFGTDQMHSGYYVLNTGDTVPAYDTGHGVQVATLGPCLSEPDSMVRMPNSNLFFCWRLHPVTGYVYADAVQVNGTLPTLISSVVVDAGSLLSQETTYTPRQIIPISSTEAISLLAFDNSVRLIYLKLNGAVLEASYQVVAGYGRTRDATLYPGVNHQGEMLMIAGNDATQVQRVGVDWSGATFTQTPLPVTQLGAVTPPNYTPRGATPGLALDRALCAASGSYLLTAREYVTDATDDNWLLTTQYKLDDGSIVHNAWAKGPTNGASTDQLILLDSALRFDTSASHVIITATEDYISGTDVLDAPRLTAYRVGYTIDDAFRSRRTGFEY